MADDVVELPEVTVKGTTQAEVPLPRPNPLRAFGYSSDNLSCVLEINGQLYRDWETVSVKVQMIETPHRIFRFTCSEGMPLVKNYAALRIRPGDICLVRLAGIPVVYGYVSSRQVFYDAHRHHIEIQGSGKTENLQHAGVASKTMEWKNVTYEQFARSLLKPVLPKMNFIVRGGQLPQIKFPRISIPHGMSIMEALELPLRALGNVKFGSTPMGDLVANVGLPSGEGDVVVEGKNIIEGREIIFNSHMADKVITSGQRPGNNTSSGPDAAQIKVNKLIEGLNMYRPQIIPLETPAFTENHLKGRGNMEHDTMANDQVTVFATVHGWLKPSGGLWEENQPVRVISPMLIMDGSEKLTSKSVTFTQDNAHGSRTVLELMNDTAMRAGVPADPRSAAAAAAAASTGTDFLPAANPPTDI